MNQIKSSNAIADNYINSYSKDISSDKQYNVTNKFM